MSGKQTARESGEDGVHAPIGYCSAREPVQAIQDGVRKKEEANAGRAHEIH